MKKSFITKECLYCYGGIFDKYTSKKIPGDICIPLVGRIGEGFVTLFEGKPIRFCFKNLIFRIYYKFVHNKFGVSPKLVKENGQ